MQAANTRKNTRQESRAKTQILCVVGFGRCIASPPLKASSQRSRHIPKWRRNLRSSPKKEEGQSRQAGQEESGCSTGKVRCRFPARFHKRLQKLIIIESLRRNGAQRGRRARTGAQGAIQSGPSLLDLSQSIKGGNVKPYGPGFQYGQYFAGRKFTSFILKLIPSSTT